MGQWSSFPLPDGSYSDGTRPWSQQDVVNYMPTPAEARGTSSPIKYATVPGLALFAAVGTGPYRGMRDVEGKLFVVSGTKLYQVSPAGVATELGTIPGTNRVSMTHNQVDGGNQVVIATGSNTYVWDTRDYVYAGISGTGSVVPATPTAPGTGGPVLVTGSLLSAYVGIPWDVQGMRDPWRVAGGAAPLRIRGTIASGLQIAYGAEGHLTGTPLAAGAASVSLTVDDRSGSSAAYTQSLTVAARPSFTMLDFSRRDDAVSAVDVNTALWSNIGGILIYQGATAGLLYAEVTTTATSVKIGIHTGALTNHNVTSGVDVAAIGTYAVAFNCTTGSLWVSNSAGVFSGDPAAGTGANYTGLPASADGRFRLGFTSRAGGQVTVNCGNSAWAYTPPVGFAGWPVVAEAVPAIWDTSTASYAELDSLGWMGRTDLSGPDLALYDGMRATVGKSAGKWQFELTSGATLPDYMQMGLCTSAFVFGGGYGLGLTGSTNSIGLEQRTSSSTSVVNTCFAGVTAATSYTYLAAEAVWTFACDLTAGTVAIYRNGTLLHTVTGVPAGTWYPAGSVRQLRAMSLTTTSLTYPVATYSDWTVTP